ncbi:putative signal transduction protein [Rhodanobacter denitrificans]|uniref:Putative signal transduction protein n=2 Tax=Rhodanobacter denitrificans TaxID=666685 RepID=M4NHH6_9GAMM|nr:putative signal transduction protein [Rhodanobacter denitrificans]
MGNMWRRIFRSRQPAARASRPQPATAPFARAAPATPAARPAAPLADIRDRFHRFVLGLADSRASEADAAELATLKQLELLGSRFDMHSLPRLPTVLPQLLRALKNDNAGGGELARLIGRDPLMVGEVMRVTGSVHYRAAQPITSLQQAVVLLGQDGLRRVLTQHVMKPILQAHAGAFGHAAGERLWHHAERCAHACAWLGRNNRCDAFEAYLAGIVCHAGDGAVIRLLDRIGPAADAEPPSPGFLAGCDALAARLSLEVAQHWELPLRVVDALAERQAAPTSAASPLGNALAVADLLAMAQLLAEHELLADDPDLSQGWPEVFAPNLVARCRQDLQRHFPDA